MKALSLFSVLMMIALADCLAGEQTSFGYEIRNQYRGHVYASRVTEEDLAKAPKWNPNFTDNPPLPPRKALNAAIAQLQKLNSRSKLGITTAFDLKSIALENLEFDRWIYQISFKLPNGFYPFQVMVLMDGTAQEITEEKRKR